MIPPLSIDFVWACGMGGDQPAVEAFLQNPALDLAAGWGYGYTAIYRAAEKGRTNIVHQLMAEPRMCVADAPHLTIGNRENNVLRASAVNGHLDLVNLFLNDPRVSITPLEANDVLRRVVRRGHSVVLERLLTDPRFDPCFEGSNMTRIAVDAKRLGALQVLLADPRVDPGDDDNVALMNAIYRGFTDVVAALVADHRVDPSARENCGIAVARERGHDDIVDILHNLDINPT